MSTVYITDLDGTLLNNNAELSDYTRRVLNAAYEDGIQVTFATARTPATVAKIMQGVNFRLPAVLLNGAVIYDTESGAFVKKSAIDRESVYKVTELMKKYGISGFAHVVEDERMYTYYDQLRTPQMRASYEERRSKFNKPYRQIPDMCGLCGKEVVYFSFLDTSETLAPFKEDIERIAGIDAVYYSDVYSNDLQYLELMAAGVSKRAGVEFLRKFATAERVVAFGDNLNDLPMFAAADVCYAVENASEEVKRRADCVVGANTADGVAIYLMQNAELRMQKYC